MRNYFRKENLGINYILHIESNESRKNMVPENSKTIYANSKTHNSIKTLRNDYNRLRRYRCSYLQPIWSLTCPYRIQESIECFGTQHFLEQNLDFSASTHLPVFGQTPISFGCGKSLHFDDCQQGVPRAQTEWAFCSPR